LGQAIPEYTIDLFSRESVRNARAVDDAVREFSPVVRLADGTVTITRHADVLAGLGDWQTYSSKSRPWHDPKSLRPEILLTDDPPRHTQVRQVMAKVLSAQMVSKARPTLERDASELIDGLLARAGRSPGCGARNYPALRARRFPMLSAFASPDASICMPSSHGLGDHGPGNELFREAMVNLEPVLGGAAMLRSGQSRAKAASGWRCMPWPTMSLLHRPKPNCSCKPCWRRLRYDDLDAGQCAAGPGVISRAISQDPGRSGPGASRLLRACAGIHPRAWPGAF
jgi:hypothetical protein